jgi:HAD superfamily hydrolase (TIGR01549 family)
MPIRWLFFDVGDVLFDENVPHLYYYHSMLLAMRRNGVNVSWDDYHLRIQDYARVKPGTAVLDAARYYVPDDALWEKIRSEGLTEYAEMRKPRPYGLLMDNMAPVLQLLRRQYRLGVIANQHPPVLQALDDYGIGPLFDVKLIDQVVGVSKPDPEIFRLALAQAGCAPQTAIMIGDRPDNDIAPARSVGMWTIRFRHGVLYTLYDPRTELEHSDLVVTVPARIPIAVEEIAARARGPA